MIDQVIREQLKERYDVSDLAEALDLSIDEMIDTFEAQIFDRLGILLDKERGIGL